ncbi:hypothetical protein B566_EDAN014646 [Ephemera danica]|nr:hypothetical protein B566_EDAN014646 [Ephemera danica]
MGRRITFICVYRAAPDAADKGVSVWRRCTNVLTGQGRISTIQLDGTQYFISNHNPYAPELNFFLAYQYCRSIGLQLASFETKEKADALTMYLKNAGQSFFLVTSDLFLFAALTLSVFKLIYQTESIHLNCTGTVKCFFCDIQTFYKRTIHRFLYEPSNEKLGKNCVALKTPDLHWALEECGDVRDFICEQTRCYYYNYGTIPVSATQG